MKLCLALMFQDEAAWLRLHLPIMLPSVDGLIALDGGSSDGGADVIRAFGGTVIERPFDWHFGEHAQFLLDAVEAAGYDAILRLDPDEVMFPQDIDAIRTELERGEFALLHLPRINFIRDRLHFNPGLDPYRQWRAWVLGKGISYRHDGAFQIAHETPAFAPGQALRTKEVDQLIFHYGALRDPYYTHWRSLTYQKLCAGEPAPDYEPIWMDWYPRQPYAGVQPLDPEEVGYRAPLDLLPMNYHLSQNLAGDRDVEYRFVEAHLSAGSGTALDFGSGGVARLSTALQKAGWTVTALDQGAITAPKGVKALVGDVLTIELPAFDLIVCCSTVEHVGLAGRYGVTEPDEDGDLKAMRKLHDALTPGGLLILTLPIGIDAQHGPMHRVYGDRLDLLLDGFERLTAAFWRKVNGRWTLCAEQEAREAVTICTSETDWQGCLYGLGGLVLRKRS